MKRMKFRFLSCIALILAFVMWFEVPASAASQYVLENYYISRTTSDGVKTTTYYFPTTDGACIKGRGYADGSYYNTSVFYQDHLQVTFDSAFNSYYIYYSPVSVTKIADSNDSFIPPSVESVTDMIISCDFMLEASVPRYGSITCHLDVVTEDNSFWVEDSVSYTASNFSDGYATIECNFNLSEASSAYSVSYEDIVSFTMYFTILYMSPSAGSTLRVSCIPHRSLPDELNPGFVFALESQKIYQAPVFTTNLSSDSFYYLVGESAAPLTVAATVDEGVISYQWYKSSTAYGSGNVISGATGNSYYPDTASEGDYYYYCIATNTDSGVTKSTKSNVAHVGVVEKPETPVIYSNLHTGTLEYYQGETAEELFFGVYAPDGGVITYQWYEGDPSYGDPEPISGATSSSYTPPTSVIGYDYYYCIATNTKGPYTQSISSREGRIQIKAPPDPAQAPVITTDLSTDPVTYKEGTAASPLRIIATSPDGGALTYQWYEVIDGTSQILAGDMNANFTPDTSAVGEHIYYCVVTNTVLNTKASVESSRATIIVEPDRTDSLLDTIIGGVSDIIDGIANLPQLILDGIKDLFIPDAEGMAAYQDKWFELLSSRFGAIYEAVVLIDEFGQAISEQTKQGIVTFPEITLNLAGVPWTFGGWEVKVVPDGFDVVIVTLKSAVNIVCTFAFVNGLRHRFEGVIGGA